VIFISADDVHNMDSGLVNLLEEPPTITNLQIVEITAENVAKMHFT